MSRVITPGCLSVEDTTGTFTESNTVTTAISPHMALPGESKLSEPHTTLAMHIFAAYFSITLEADRMSFVCFFGVYFLVANPFFVFQSLHKTVQSCWMRAVYRTNAKSSTIRRLSLGKDVQLLQCYFICGMRVFLPYLLQRVTHGLYITCIYFLFQKTWHRRSLHLTSAQRNPESSCLGTVRANVKSSETLSHFSDL